MAEQHSGWESRLAHSLHQFLWNSPDYLVSKAHTQSGDHCAERRQSKNKGASVFVALWRLFAPTAGDYRDAITLYDRVAAKLAGDAFVVSTSASSHSSARRVLISHGERI
jgi:hypothetical protein